MVKTMKYSDVECTGPARINFQFLSSNQRLLAFTLFFTIIEGA